MQVIIMAGGRGTRLHPYTVTLPKPLVPIGDYPILEIILRQLKRAGATEIILSTGHLAELIQAYFGDGQKWGIPLRYVRETQPLSTAGPLGFIGGLEENFMVMNGDILTLLDFRRVWQKHLDGGAIATIGVHQRNVGVDFGVIEMDPAGLLKSYQEKPQLAYFVSMGINVLNRRCCGYFKPGEPLGMPEFLLRMKEAGEKILCHISQEEWLDIGRPDDYEIAQKKFKQSRDIYFSNA